MINIKVSSKTILGNTFANVELKDVRCLHLHAFSFVD